MFLKISLFILFVINSAFASYQSALNVYSKGSMTIVDMTKVIDELMKGGYHYSVIPLLKEYAAENKNDNFEKLDDLFDVAIKKVGIKQFESLPINILEKTNSRSVKFIIAKKLFRQKKYNNALSVLKSISKSNYLYPFSQHLEASIYSIQKKFDLAINSYDICIKASDRTADDVSRQNQLNINRDHCIAGRARAYFAKRDFAKADLAYLDLPKSSYIWPEILFEEAWNSFYQENYNRTLGKLVTYKSPFLNYIYNPEVDVLNAFTYLKMCLWDDVKNSVDGFYNQFMNPANMVRSILSKYRKDYKFYYNAALSRRKDKSEPEQLFNKMLNSVIREPAYIEMMNSLENALREHTDIQAKSETSLRSFLLSSILETIRLQRDTIGAYIRTRLLIKYTQLFHAFQQMSYIKLEVLNHKKRQLYVDQVSSERVRGDLKYVARNEKQYFWTFNGEFWADELGDYVFALKSECK